MILGRVMSMGYHMYAIGISSFSLPCFPPLPARVADAAAVDISDAKINPKAQAHNANHALIPPPIPIFLMLQTAHDPNRRNVENRARYALLVVRGSYSCRQVSDR